MNFINTILPFSSSVVSFVFAALIFRRYLARRGPHLLLWGIGMVFYGIGGFCEAYYGAKGWNDLVFRLWYLFGGVTGIYFLDAAEAFFHLTPSPFRSVIFQALFVVVSLFVVSSSGSLFASGLVLILYLTLILIAVGELRMVGNLDSWYQMVAGKVTLKAQQSILTAFIIVFFIETLLLIRS